MNSFEKATYSEFSQMFIAIKSELDGLSEVYKKIKEVKAIMPKGLIDEITICILQHDSMVNVAKERWSKNEVELYKDGLGFLLAEDLEVKKNRYGS